MLAAGTKRLDHVVSAEQFDRALIEYVLERAEALSDVRDTRLQGRIAATLFYEPSTRTRLSFESAMLRLGGSVLGTESASVSSSAAKGETLEDAIQVTSGYADLIVLRHSETGAAARVAASASVPVINAGDGSGEHPTQALLDLLCLQRELGGIDNLHIAICGDLLHGRTAHSLVVLLSRFSNVTIELVAPGALQLDAAAVVAARDSGVTINTRDTLDPVIGDVRAVYQTRVQLERFNDPVAAAAATALRIDTSTMKRLREDAVVMHPLPRVGEIDPAVDTDPRAAYFRQAIGGVAVRMALLEMLLV